MGSEIVMGMNDVPWNCKMQGSVKILLSHKPQSEKYNEYVALKVEVLVLMMMNDP